MSEINKGALWQKSTPSPNLKYYSTISSFLHAVQKIIKKTLSLEQRILQKIFPKNNKILASDLPIGGSYLKVSNINNQNSSTWSTYYSTSCNSKDSSDILIVDSCRSLSSVPIHEWSSKLLTAESHLLSAMHENKQKQFATEDTYGGNIDFERSNLRDHFHLLKSLISQVTIDTVSIFTSDFEKVNSNLNLPGQYSETTNTRGVKKSSYEWKVDGFHVQEYNSVNDRKLIITFSLPKILDKNTNLLPFDIKRIDEVKQKLSEALTKLGYKLNIDTCKISRIDIAKNIILDKNFLFYKHIIRMLNFRNLNLSKYEDDGIIFGNKRLTLEIYNKTREIKKHKAKFTDPNIGVFLNVYDNRILRIEFRIKEREQILREAEKIYLNVDATFASLSKDYDVYKEIFYKALAELFSLETEKEDKDRTSGISNKDSYLGITDKNAHFGVVNTDYAFRGALTIISEIETTIKNSYRKTDTSPREFLRLTGYYFLLLYIKLVFQNKKDFVRFLVETFNLSKSTAYYFEKKVDTSYGKFATQFLFEDDKYYIELEGKTLSEVISISTDSKIPEERR